MERDPPIESIPTQIHEPPAPMDVGFERVKHRSAVILGMRAGQHDPVVLDQRQSFAVQILIGNDVEAFASVFEPTQDVRIGVELPYVGTGAAQGPNDLGLHVDDRPQARAVEYARPVIVNVVETKAEFRVLLHEQVMFLMLQEPSDHESPLPVRPMRCGCWRTLCSLPSAAGRQRTAVGPSRGGSTARGT